MCTCDADERENASCESSYSDSFDDDSDDSWGGGGGGANIVHRKVFGGERSSEISDVMAGAGEEEMMEDFFAYEQPPVSNLLELSEDQMVRQCHHMYSDVSDVWLRWPWLYLNH